MIRTGIRQKLCAEPTTEADFGGSTRGVDFERTQRDETKISRRLKNKTKKIEPLSIVVAHRRSLVRVFKMSLTTGYNFPPSWDLLSRTAE